MALMGANLRPDETAVYSWAFELLQPLSDTIDEMISNDDTWNEWKGKMPVIYNKEMKVALAEST